MDGDMQVMNRFSMIMRLKAHALERADHVRDSDNSIFYKFLCRSDRVF